jgi:hypothetical protein
MTKFLTLWELDRTRIPDSPEEQLHYYAMMLDMINEDMKNGRTREFGAFVGGFKGFVIREGNEQEIYMEISKYAKFTNHTTYPFLEIGQLKELLKAQS